MARNTVFEEADYLSLPVPDGTKSGDPVRIGGLNAVAQTSKGQGGNPAGNASCMLRGAHDLSVDGAVANVGDPVYIDAATRKLDVNNANPLFGHALETKAAAAGVIRVRLVN